MAAINGTDSMVVDGKTEQLKEIFDEKTKAIIWGMQPRAVQVDYFDVWFFHIQREGALRIAYEQLIS